MAKKKKDAVTTKEFLKELFANPPMKACLYATIREIVCDQLQREPAFKQVKADCDVIYKNISSRLDNQFLQLESRLESKDRVLRKSIEEDVPDILRIRTAALDERMDEQEEEIKKIQKAATQTKNNLATSNKNYATLLLCVKSWRDEVNKRRWYQRLFKKIGTNNGSKTKS